MEITLNNEQRHFVQNHGEYVTCLGFDYAYQQACKVAAWMTMQPPRKEDIGTIKGYEYCSLVMKLGAQVAAETGQKCNADLIPEFIGKEGQRVEVITCYGTKERFYIGKSTGWMPCHLMIKTRRSSGGCAVLGTPFKSITFIRQK